MNRRLSAIFSMGLGVSLAAGLATQTRAAAETVYDGVIAVTLEINIGTLTPVPTGDIVYCELSISIDDIGGTSGSITESVFVQATLANSQYGTCSTNFPYQAALALVAEDKATVSYSVYMVPSSGTGNIFGKAFDREVSNYSAASVTLPKNNGTASVTLATKF